MMLTRRSPNRDLLTLHDEMDRLFDSMFQPRGEVPETLWAPPADIRETRDAYIVRMDLPGIDSKNVKVSVFDGNLTVRGERREVRDEKEATWQRVERFHGQFERRFQIGAVQADQIQATYRDGVLEINIPKAESAKPREIEVRVQSNNS